MIITTVKEASEAGVLGSVTDCFDAGDVKEIVLCGEEFVVIMTDDTQISIPGDDEPDSWQRCPRCDAGPGEEHTCQNPIRV